MFTMKRKKNNLLTYFRNHHRVNIVIVGPLALLFSYLLLTVPPPERGRERERQQRGNKNKTDTLRVALRRTCAKKWVNEKCAADEKKYMQNISLSRHFHCMFGGTSIDYVLT